jgi:prephenate dehydratase
MVSTYDTAGSVIMIKEGNMKECAAIAAERNAALYGLSVIARRIEGKADNFTRFLIISRERGERRGPSKTSIIFGVDHSPGSLYRALGPFAELGINLSKIESRPKKGIPWEYYFFMDFEGDIEERRCAEAVSKLRGVTQYVKVLGSYSRAVPPKKR